MNRRWNFKFGNLEKLMGKMNFYKFPKISLCENGIIKLSKMSAT